MELYFKLKLFTEYILPCFALIIGAIIVIKEAKKAKKGSKTGKKDEK